MDLISELTMERTNWGMHVKILSLWNKPSRGTLLETRMIVVDVKVRFTIYILLSNYPSNIPSVVAITQIYTLLSCVVLQGNFIEVIVPNRSYKKPFLRTLSEGVWYYLQNFHVFPARSTSFLLSCYELRCMWDTTMVWVSEKTTNNFYHFVFPIEVEYAMAHQFHHVTGIIACSFCFHLYINYQVHSNNRFFHLQMLSEWLRVCLPSEESRLSVVTTKQTTVLAM